MIRMPVIVKFISKQPGAKANIPLLKIRRRMEPLSDNYVVVNKEGRMEIFKYERIPGMLEPLSDLTLREHELEDTNYLFFYFTLSKDTYLLPLHAVFPGMEWMLTETSEIKKYNMMSMNQEKILGFEKDPECIKAIEEMDLPDVSGVSKQKMFAVTPTDLWELFVTEVIDCRSENGPGSNISPNHIKRLILARYQQCTLFTLRFCPDIDRMKFDTFVSKNFPQTHTWAVENLLRIENYKKEKKNKQLQKLQNTKKKGYISLADLKG